MKAFEDGAAPHLPAGILSPYSDGERDALTCGFANRRRCRKGANVAASLLLPVTIRGEGAGRRMRGSAEPGDWLLPSNTLSRFAEG
ncbi:MAG: hypothetical protein EOS40_33750 [Mesorhizobium sp.]|nr:MAG: hypothetical protein EOS40_33750 [Mesorhizobium sp.]